MIELKYSRRTEMLMKKLLCAVLTAVLVLAPVCSARAAESPLVYAQAVQASAGQTLTVPVMIKNGAGIRAFELALYPGVGIEILAVSPGELTENGKLTQDKTSGGTPVRVAWSHSRAFEGDGTLARVELKITEKARRSSSLGMTFLVKDSTQTGGSDTYLECRGAAIAVADGFEDTTAAGETAGAQETTNPDSGHIEDAVDDALEQVGADRIDDIPEEKREEFASAVNENLENSGAERTGELEGVSEIDAVYRDAVKDNYVSGVMGSHSSDEILEAVDSALEAAGAESVEELPREKRSEFVSEVAEELSAAPDIAEKLGEDDAADAVGRLYKAASAPAAAHGAGTDTDAGTGTDSVGASGVVRLSLTIAGCIIAALAAAAAVTVIVRKKRG